MMENMISVIVCTYNQENTIARTLDSILMQQCHLPYEIVIGEDCSTDRTLDICQEYAKQQPDKIRIIANIKNKGIVDNYFDCLLAAQGKYIADCAGDDFWTDPQKLEKELTILEDHPEVTLVHTNWLYYDEEKGTTYPPIPAESKQTRPFIDGKELLEDIVTQTQRPIIHLCTSLYRRDVFLQAYQKDKDLFRNKDFGCEDVPISFIMAQNGHIAYLPDITLNYSMGKTTISNTMNEERQYHFVKQVTNLSYYICTRYQMESQRIDDYFKQRIFGLSMHAFRCHSKTMRDEVRKLKSEWHVKDNIPIHVIHLIMSDAFIWRMGLMTRSLFVRWKKMIE